MTPSPEHALVTGGSSGIGWAVVQRLLDRGLDVTVLDLNPPAEQHRTDAGTVRYVALDVTDQRAVDEAVRDASDRAGTPTRLVTSHGIRGGFVAALDLDLDLMRRVLDVHVVGTLVVARAMVRAMVGAGTANGDASGRDRS